MIRRIAAAALVLCMLIGLCACGKKQVDDEGYIIAQKPDGETERIIHETADTFMKGLEEKNAKAVFPLLSENFGATEEEINSFFEQIDGLTKNPFVKFDEYYVKDMTVSEDSVKVKKDTADENHIEFTPKSPEICAVLYVSEGEKISYMLTVLLAKDEDSWKIVQVNPGDMKYNGHPAAELYETAKKLRDEDKLIASYIYTCMLGNILRPTGYFFYGNDTEMEDLCYQLYSKITEKFELPLALSETANSAVYEIGIANDPEHGIIPQILFKTDVKTDDSKAVNAEAERVLTALEKLSNGMRDTFDYVCFKATNDTLTDSTTNVNSVTVTIPTK